MATSLGVVLSVLFTAGGLIYTGLTWQTSQETQITDRYTKAVEQLGSKSVDVRLGGLYALNRIAADSHKDASTIQNVMAAFARNRDFCKQKIGKNPCAVFIPDDTVTTGTGILQVPVDVRAALELAASLVSTTGRSADLASVRFHEAYLSNVTLTGANLRDANLPDADLKGANLKGASLRGVRGMTADQIRKVAITDATTQF